MSGEAREQLAQVYENGARRRELTGDLGDAVDLWVQAARQWRKVARSMPPALAGDAHLAELRCIREVTRCAERWADSVEPVAHPPAPTQAGGQA